MKASGGGLRGPSALTASLVLASEALYSLNPQTCCPRQLPFPTVPGSVSTRPSLRSWVTQKLGARPGWGGSAELKQGDELRVGYLGRHAEFRVPAASIRERGYVGCRRLHVGPLIFLPLKEGQSRDS